MQETYGEDPWMSGYFATAYVKGLQGGIYVCVHVCIWDVPPPL